MTELFRHFKKIKNKKKLATIKFKFVPQEMFLVKSEVSVELKFKLLSCENNLIATSESFATSDCMWSEFVFLQRVSDRQRVSDVRSKSKNIFKRERC